MSQPSPDARAVVRAVEALTTQVRRIADGTSTPVVDVAPGVAVVHGHPVVATDDDAHRIARRREAVLNLLNRLDRHDTLTREESALLRIHVADEGLEHDTARTEATRLGLMVDEYGKGASTLGKKLRQAQAAIERVRDYLAYIERAGWTQAAIARRILAALDGTEQPTTKD
jgi:ribosomal protein S11